MLPCKGWAWGQLAIATVMCASGCSTHQLNGAYSCSDALTTSLQVARPTTSSADPKSRREAKDMRSTNSPSGLVSTAGCHL